MPVLVSSGATAGLSYRMSGPGRGPGPEYSDDALALAFPGAASAATDTSAASATPANAVASVARAALRTPAESRIRQEYHR